LAPSLRAIARIGWAIFLWGIFGIIWYLFFGSQQTPKSPPHWTAPWLLFVGTALAILFANPSRNPLKAIGVGLASFPLTALGTFSDSISYIRLMGVGLASTIIAQTFNSLAAQVAGAAGWFVAAPVALLGHALNIAMCMIAVLAHGVRLNMLEFSNNAGVQWAGHAYTPFAKAEKKEP
jgi:V/A-type H+-transporting ATPase subunit I